ncbi:hypothetical protein DFP72DRAFT_935003 [Ephemerocybe angulata]|uniref:F-box domain-containing protein n=1 Tax=Ephemerocybe angulata TaxID=980116 RepID=A0A8H6LTG2_9AGAR|nr:hypothetical protein DFP72DRAFT_935003 [Tulosesus angulatus]
MTRYTLVDLPVEILDNIFENCLPDRLMAASPRPDRAPLLLGHVCSSWRKASHRNPKLWTMLCLVCLDCGESVEELLGKEQRMIEKANFWLERCGAQRISLSFLVQALSWTLFMQLVDISRGPDGNPNLETQSIFGTFVDTILQKNLDRFNTLLLQWPGCTLNAMPFNNKSPPLPVHVETLAIGGDESMCTTEALNHLSSFCTSKSLKKLHIGFETRHRSWKSPPTTIPWKQLTNLSLDAHMSFSSAYLLLQNCPNLRECRLRIRGPVKPSASIHFNPHLESATLTFERPEFALEFLQPLDIPNIHSLKLRGSLDGFCGLVDANTPLARSVYPRFGMLKSLALTYPYFTDQALIELFMAVPLLTHLTLSSIQGWEAFAEALSREGTESILPELTHLRLHLGPLYKMTVQVPPVLPFHEEPFMRGITSRRARGSPLDIQMTLPEAYASLLPGLEHALSEICPDLAESSMSVGFVKDVNLQEWISRDRPSWITPGTLPASGLVQRRLDIVY